MFKVTKNDQGDFFITACNAGFVSLFDEIKSNSMVDGYRGYNVMFEGASLFQVSFSVADSITAQYVELGGVLS
jgi:hypothetical protein